MGMPEKNLFQLCLFKRVNHSAGVAMQMNIESIIKIGFSTLENRWIQSIRRGFVNKNTVSQPLLHFTVELLDRHTTSLTFCHQFLCCIAVNAAQVNHCTQGSLQPERVAS